jgi:CHAT domain-containing protein
VVDAVDEADVADVVGETDAVDDPEVADAVDDADASDAVDGADAVDVADVSGLYDEFDGAFTEDEINVIESVLSAVETGADDTPLLAAGPVEFDSFSALTDAFTGADIDGDTGFSSSPTSEPEAAAGLDSLEGAMALSDSAGETMLSARGVTVDVSMGSSFTVEAQGSAESVESSTPASSSNGGSATSTSGSSAGTDAGSTVSSSAPAAATPGGAPVASVPAQQAVAGLNQADQAQSQALVNSVLPERSGSAITAPSVTQMQSGLSKAAASIRAGVGLGADSAGGLGPQSWLPRGLLLGSEADQLMASANTLIAASDVGGAAVLPPSFNRAAYNPAILHVRFTQARDKVSSSSNDAFLDITLIPLDGEPEGRRVELSQQAFANDLRTLYRQLSRQEALQVDDPKSPSRRLYDQLFAVITPVLQQRGITTLLISADRGLQAVPFAALHNGERYFGDRYAFSLTPSLALTNLSPPTTGGGRLLAAGASEFVGLAPLPLVPTELTMMSTATIKDTALNQQFTPSTLLEQAADPRYNRVHVATHAEFLPGGPAKSKLYSGTVPIALSDFVKLRLARRDAPLDLISFSACRTALGDAESELGFAGLALQAGARSAVGTLWYVDDVATSAYFVQLYRYLDAGVPKADALQLTRQAFARGLVRVQGDQMVGPDGAVLSTGLTTAQQRRAAAGLSNPYFWAGIELLGSPW